MVDFSPEAIRDRADFNDHYRSKNSLPYVDSDLHALLSMNKELLEALKHIKTQAEKRGFRERHLETQLDSIFGTALGVLKKYKEAQ